MLTAVDWMILALSFLLLWGSHHFPWRIIPGVTDRRGELTKVPSYVVGVGSILGCMAVWAYWHNDWEAFAFLVLVCITAGLGTVTPRIAKQQAEFQALREDVQEAWDDAPDL